MVKMASLGSEVLLEVVVSPENREMMDNLDLEETLEKG
jgi:hypothetical protein